ncbi:rhodanese-like domain-containing protein [Acidiphilium sp.]|jgi:rhodanese-related sulfurtransferase|uniref:rhodanese-like domain-containing protein n=1 Tax=Acidiphilium TaxID=522 RepID=UPI00258E3213|nr:rhodanese-like domain-containing protein [Acidiphilium sp.]
MARTPKHAPLLSLLTAAAAAVPPLPTALVVMAPMGAALAAAPGATASTTLAQAIARGDTQIAPAGVRALIMAQRRDFTLIDIRAPKEFAAGHIRDARNVPISQLALPQEINRLRRSPQVILYGNATDKAAEAAVMLRASGVMARAMTGGLAAWGQALEAAAARPDQAAMVRALNLCPEIVATPIAPAPAAPEAAPAAPQAAPKAPAGTAPVNLNGMCG